MAKTRRTKTNKSPIRPYRNAKAFIAVKGDTVITKGVRGRTRVKRVIDEKGKRVKSIRVVEDVRQQIASVKRGQGIFVGRVYTGVPRSKPYPYRGKKRGGVIAPPPVGLLARAAKAVKQVVVRG